jgi:fission process protein 1
MFWSKPPSDPNPKPAKDEKPPAPVAVVTNPLTPSRADPAEPSKNNDNTAIGNLVEGYAAESTESNIRYAAYAPRIRTILMSAHRYVAYTSDIGESFRPVAHPNIVRGAYGISWIYILGDVGYEGYKSYLHNERVRNPALQLTPRQARIVGHNSPVKDATDATADKPEKTPGQVAHEVEEKKRQPGVVPPIEDYRTVMVQRAIFQSLASMGLPAFTIHSVVKYSGKALKEVKSTKLRTWGPIGLGLSVVPFLPSIFDEPIENAVEWAFHSGFRAAGGDAYVGHAPTMGREDLLAKRPKV